MAHLSSLTHKSQLLTSHVNHRGLDLRLTSEAEWVVEINETHSSFHNEGRRMAFGRVYSWEREDE